MNLLRIAFPLLLCVIAGTIPAYSQLASAVGPPTGAGAAAQQQYDASFAGHPQLYSGPEYLDYAKRYHAQVGHQFFGEPTPQPGSVDYNEHSFSGLPLAYDLVRDQVVISPPGSPLTLRLVNEFVRSFAIGDHRFVRLVADSASNSVISTGFYELLTPPDAPVQVLAKRAKRQQERVVVGQIDVEFTATDRVFLKKAGTYYPVKSKGAVVRTLVDRGPEMQAYLKAHKLSFRKPAFEASLVELASYYASLPPR